MELSDVDCRALLSRSTRWSGSVLPFLLGDTVVARVDLKSDRSGGALAVLGAFAEPGVDRHRVAAALARELRSLAGWLGLATVTIADRGDLSGPLASARY